MKRTGRPCRSSSMDRQRGSSRTLSLGSSLGRYSCVDITKATEDASNNVLSDYDEVRRTGIRYITEDLIKKLTKQDNVTSIRSLNLSSTRGDKVFRYIENLDKCEHLQVLNLSNNSIEKIEKLEKLHKLQELHLFSNKIRKIEGLENLVNLRILNLANNSIEQVPLWLAKKLRSLQTLNLQKNNIFSLHELAKLKLLKNLTELTLAENPVSNLAHYRLYIVFHLRSLDLLDGQPISEQEREQAHQRFHTEEVDRLEQELEEKGAEIERLQKEKVGALKELEQQENLQQSLILQSQEQQHRREELEMELDTKSELLKQKTSELTRACQKQYELEQELAFHKIDAKFEPLPYEHNHDLDGENALTESPYIGKARHRRNPLMTHCVDTGFRLLSTGGHTVWDSTQKDETRNVLAGHAEERLKQLNEELKHKESRILRAHEELQQLEEAATEKRISEPAKEHLRSQLKEKIQKLGELQHETEDLEKHLHIQSAEMRQTQGEMEHLQNLLHTLEVEDPRHAYVKAQLASTSQLLAIMSRKQRELEGRLDDMLTRIAKETQDIKDLEQQLTDGQIAVNEALKNDLESIISGLQEYLHGVKDQARQAQADCVRLQRERDSLQLLLQDKEKQVIHLQEATHISDYAQKEFLQHREELHALIRENAELREARRQVSTYESELEAQLHEKDKEAGQLKEELSRLQRLSQLEHSALQEELQEERQAKENALIQLQLAAERELENTQHLQQLSAVQREKGALMEEVSDLRNELQQVRRELMCPKQVVSFLDGLRKSIATGSSDLCTFSGNGDLLNRSLANLQDEVHRSVSAALKDSDEAQCAQDRLTRELGSLRHRLRTYEQKYQSVCEEKHVRAAERQAGEAELTQLRENLHEAHEQQYMMLQRLQEAESERDRLLSELDEQDKQMKADEIITQDQVQSLDLEIQELRRSFTTADRMAVEQLNAAKEKIRSLHNTVQKISQERAENAEELEESRIQAAQAMQDLTRAEVEIQVLQKLLQDRVHVFDEPMDSLDDPLQPDLARMNQALKNQQAQTKRLRDQLAQANDDNRGNVEELLEEVEELRDTLRQQSNYLPTFSHNSHNRGQWHYIPPNPNPPSLGSQATQDSGLGSQYVPSPDREKRFRGKQHNGTKPTSSRAPSYRNSDGESHDNGNRGPCFTPPPGSVIYTVPPDGTPLPAGTVIYAPPVPGLGVHPGTVLYGPPPQGVRLVYGPPPSGLHIPLICNGTLLCNVPSHRDLEFSLKEAERCLREQESGKEVVGQELLKLEEQRSELQMQLKELRRAVGRLQHHRRLLESSVSSAEEESVTGDVKCLEKTLLQCRTELRETGRLLLEAEAGMKDTRTRTKDTQQCHSEAKRRLRDTERDLEETEWRAQDNVKQLTKAKQQLRDVQDEMKDLQRRRQSEELTLQKLEKMIATRDAELELINRNSERATTELQNLKRDIREKQSQEAKLLVSCKDSEETLNQRKKDLEHLNNQLLMAKDEQSLLSRKLEQWREEEGVMKTSVERNRFGLVGVLRQGEDEAHGLQQRIKDLHADMQNLAVQKGELDTQLSDKKERLAKYKKEEQKTKVTVQKLRSVISKHREDLKQVLDMIQLESAELERVKSQHSQKLDQLEKSHENLLQVNLELKTAQQELQDQRSEHERQTRQQEEETRTLKEKMDVMATQRSSLLEQCTNLEARRTHAKRCLETAEEGARKAEAEIRKIEEELTKLKHDHRQAQSIHEEMKRNIAADQKQLEETTGELSKVEENVSQSRHQLEELRKDVKDSQQELDDLADQQQEQHVVLLDKIQRRQQRVDKLEQQLKELETAVAWKRTQYEEEEERLKTLEQQSLESEEVQRRQQQKLQSQLQGLEEGLAQRVEKMDQVSAALEELEEKRCYMLADQKQCSLLQDRVVQLEQHLAESEARCRASSDDQREARQELDAYRCKIQLLQETLGTGRTQIELWGQAEGKTRLREVWDTARSLKDEVQAELDSSIKELKFQSMDYSGIENCENNSSGPRHDGKAAYKPEDTQWHGELLRDKLKQHEDHLKAQLRRTMNSQQEALSLRRQQTEGSILGLRRRVDQLDQLLGKSDHDPHYKRDSEIPNKCSYFETERWKHHESGERSFSPESRTHKHTY